MVEEKLRWGEQFNARLVKSMDKQPISSPKTPFNEASRQMRLVAAKEEHAKSRYAASRREQATAATASSSSKGQGSATVPTTELEESLQRAQYYEKESEKDYQQVRQKLKKQQDYLLQREEERRETEKADRDRQKKKDKEESKRRELKRLRDRSLERSQDIVSEMATDVYAEREKWSAERQQLQKQVERYRSANDEGEVRLTDVRSEVSRLRSIIKKQPGLSTDMAVGQEHYDAENAKHEREQLAKRLTEAHCTLERMEGELLTVEKEKVDLKQRLLTQDTSGANSKLLLILINFLSRRARWLFAARPPGREVRPPRCG